LKKAINLIENREEFAKYKGYDAMLYAFKCKKMPYFGDDPDIDTFMPLYKVNTFWYLWVIPNKFLRTNLCVYEKAKGSSLLDFTQFSLWHFFNESINIK